MTALFLPAAPRSFRARPLSSLIFACAAMAGATPVFAAGTMVDAMVVPGYVQSPAIAVAPPPTTYVAAPPPQMPASRGNYGGGFIEMMMGAGAPPPMPDAVLYNRPGQASPYGRRSEAPARSYVAYAPPQAAYEANRTVAPEFLRTEVDYRSSEPAGTIVVDTPAKHLYFVNGNGRATRYGIGVGRPGFTWSGVKSVTRKAEWPDWIPPQEMLLRRPDLPRHMAGGPANPLGARALYLGSSLYRIHGTNEPTTIGQNVSSGCIRMMNEDVTDLYSRARVGTRVVVM